LGGGELKIGLDAVLHEKIKATTLAQGVAQRVAQLVAMCGHCPGPPDNLVDLLQVL